MAMVVAYQFYYPSLYIYLLELMGLMRYAFFLFTRHFNLFPSPCNTISISDEERIRTAIEVRRNLPVVSFASLLERKKGRGCNLGDHQHECAICMSCLKLSDEVRELSKYCPHAFHRDCLDSWLDQGQLSCPLCRSMLCTN